MTTPPSVIDRRTMSTRRMALFTLHATGPLVVMVGGIPAAYAASGTPGLPLGLLIVVAGLWVMAEPYAAASRRVPHAAPYYAVVARGLGRPAGVAAGLLAMTMYGSIVWCMYALLGAQIVDLFGGVWWIYALLGCALVAVIGVRPVVESSWVLMLALTIAVLIIGMLIGAAVANPADGHLSSTGFSPHALLTGNVAAALVMCVASLIGVDVAQSFSTEAVVKSGPRRALRVAMPVLGIGYALLAWAIGVANGPAQVAAAAADHSIGVPLNTLTDGFGFLVGPLTQLALLGQILATVLAVHAIGARYAYAMAAERVLAGPVAHTGSGDLAGSPVGGSVLQSVLGVTVITVGAAFGADPMTMFAVLAAVSAISMITLLVAAALAAVRCLRRDDGWWPRWVAPLLGAPIGVTLASLMIGHMGDLLGSGPGSVLPLVVVLMVLAPIAGGLVWALVLASWRRRVYAGISHGVPGHLEVPDRRLAELHL